MEDAGKAIEGESQPSVIPEESRVQKSDSNRPNDSKRQNNYDRRKRKADSSMHHGSRGREGGRGEFGDNKRHKKGDMGRGEYL